MKTSTTKLFIICCFLFGAFVIQAQETRTITLNVNTAEITRRNVNDNADFGQEAEITNEEFTIEVRLGDTVVWDGLSTSSEDDYVEIVSINHEGGARLFDKNVLNGEDGIVSAVVSKGKDGDSEKYTIKFRVYRDGKRMPGIFKIDPKLVVKR